MADGNNFILGQVNNATSETQLHRAGNNVGSGLFVINDNGQGIQGTGGPGFPGVQGFSPNSVGVHGISDGFDGVNGLSHAGGTNAHAGVAGINDAGGFGLWGQSDAQGGIGIQARGAQHAAVFNGHIQHNGDFDCTGTVNVETDIILANADCAEEFDVLDAAVAEPGTVMVLDGEGAVKPSCLAYDRKVAGIISGAGDYRPGITLDKRASAHPRSALALVGKVYCKVDASYAPIEVGDMLTSSPTRGHAMKAVDAVKSFGAVIGKALKPISAGEGLIPVLVALQ